MSDFVLLISVQESMGYLSSNHNDRSPIVERWAFNLASRASNRIEGPENMSEAGNLRTSQSPALPADVQEP
jgi:hypothetical protein